MVTGGNQQKRGLQVDRRANVGRDNGQAVTDPEARSMWMRQHGMLLAEAGHSDILVTKHQAVAIESGDAQVR